MVIAEGHLAIIIRTTRAGPATTLLTDRLRLARNKKMETLTSQDENGEVGGSGEFIQHSTFIEHASMF